ncbi:MAG TPA: hypoxanthine phosphoribosyltransferase [Ignavibacteria bacterium]
MKRFISESRIKARVKYLADKINMDYQGKTPIFIGILNGSFIFLSDLIREIKVDCEIDFMKLSSYGDTKISSGQIKILKELNCEIKDRDILLVEDIIDSGLSISFMKSLVEKENPGSLKIASLLFKKNVSNLNFEIDYVGFEIENEFVVGYGLDFAQKYRNLKGIFVL